jgi:hypothetical protein
MESKEFAITIIGDWIEQKTGIVYQFNEDSTLKLRPKQSHAVIKPYYIGSLQGTTILTIEETQFVVKSVTQNEEFGLTVCLISRPF